MAEPADAPDVAHDDKPVLDSPKNPWPVFLTLLLANGWFLRPVPFDQRARKDTVPQTQRNAMLRVPVFAAAWIAAFAVLPLWATTLCLAAWLVKVVPGIRQVGQSFQSVGPDDPPTRVRGAEAAAAGMAPT